MYHDGMGSRWRADRSLRLFSNFGDFVTLRERKFGATHSILCEGNGRHRLASVTTDSRLQFRNL